MGLVGVDLNNVNLDDVKFDMDDPDTTTFIRFIAWRNGYKSSNINEGIKAVLFFKRKDFTRKKSTKSTKRKQATFTHTFFTRIKRIKSIKSTKSSKRQTSDFLFLRCFYAHKNAAFFVLHTKSTKST